MSGSNTKKDLMMSNKFVQNVRRANRLLEETRALKALAKRNSRFSFTLCKRGYLFRFTDTPGLIQTTDGISLWNQWDVRILLPPRYPIDQPWALIVPHACTGRPIHPNVLPTIAPCRVCYGRYRADTLLDELALRMYRIITLRPEAIMTDERNALNPSICHIVRRLIREKHVPLTLNTSLPGWCRASGRPGREKNDPI